MDVNFIVIYHNVLYLSLNTVCFIFYLEKKQLARLEIDK